ncbi:MAG: methionyl-tRNA formyltransferase [Thermoleophilaceae bacterium]|nr:methionyl-tRNA formyltransferase [Thermoleophilaceae bacterium]
MLLEARARDPPFVRALQLACEPMRTVYLGTSPFAVTVLERVAASAHRPVAVVTRPDRPKGRGRRVAAPPVAAAARGLGIDLLQPESVNSEEARAQIADLRPDGVLICAFGALIREPLLSDFPIFNVHPSLLPRWRGAAPIERAIEAGDAETGVTIMRPVMEMDAGPICLQRAEPIHPGDDYGSLSERLAALGGARLVEPHDTGPPGREPPDEAIPIAPKLEAADRVLDPALEAALLERRVRALTPHVGAFVLLPAGERLGVRRAAVSDAPPPPPSEFAVADGRLLFGCVDGALELIEVQPAGGRPMDAASYLRGNAAAIAPS